MLKPHEKQLLARLGGPLIAADQDGRVVHVTPEAAAVLQRVPDGMVGRPLKELMPQRMAARHEAGFERYRSTGRLRLAGKVLEAPAVRGDGKEIALRLSLRLFKRADGSDLIVARMLRPDEEGEWGTVALEEMGGR